MAFCENGGAELGIVRNNHAVVVEEHAAVDGEAEGRVLQLLLVGRIACGSCHDAQSECGGRPCNSGIAVHQRCSCDQLLLRWCPSGQWLLGPDGIRTRLVLLH